MRNTLTHALYLLFVDLVFYCLVVHPVSAFQLSSSTTGYVRVASQTAVTSMVAAQRAATLSSVASLVSTSTAGSIGVRLVAGAVGWPALGIVAGITLAMLYYDATKTAQIKAAATPPAPWSIPGFTNTFTGATTMSAVTDPAWPQYDYALNTAFAPMPPAPNTSTCQYLTMPNGWTGPWTFKGTPCVYLHQSAAQFNATDPTFGTQPAPSAQEIATYVGGLPSNSPLSIESNTVPVGAQATPTPSDATASNPVPATELPTAVVPASQVGPTDLVVNPNATPPPGTIDTKTATQTTTGTKTTTTTTTTNPDGSTTKTDTTTETETAPAVTCAAGNHEQRSFGGILQTHMDTWKGSGLLSALNLLSTLVWPTTSPTYTLTSSFLGTFTFDFTPWAGMLLAIRSIIIAIAGFVAYKIIFVGSRA